MPCQSSYLASQPGTLQAKPADSISIRINLQPHHKEACQERRHRSQVDYRWSYHTREQLLAGQPAWMKRETDDDFAGNCHVCRGQQLSERGAADVDNAHNVAVLWCRLTTASHRQQSTTLDVQLTWPSSTFGNNWDCMLIFFFFFLCGMHH